MPRIYKPANTVQDFTIVGEISRGMTAISYRATGAEGRDVFLKQYKSPTITVPWYPAYKTYQSELRRRVESGACQHFCYRFLDSFEYQRCFFQAFEFLDRSYSLAEILQKCRRNPRHANEHQRLIMAKVLLTGIAALHKNAIIHSDLKPDNIMLIRDKAIMAGYRLRIIDMDFSLLADRKAPWHGERGYFGTVGYLSPEHLSGGIPGPHSDVFTLGLILHELLGDGHPYASLDDAQYLAACRAHSAKPLKLHGTLAELPNADKIRAIVHACLCPSPGERPSSLDVNRVLNRTAREDPVDKTESPPLAPHDKVAKKAADPATAGEPTTKRRSLQLTSESGVVRRFNVRTTIGRHLASVFGKDAMFYDDVQFVVSPVDGTWIVEPNPKSKNRTLLNGAVLDAPHPLAAGDVLSVGNPSKRLQKLLLTTSYISADEREK